MIKLNHYQFLPNHRGQKAGFRGQTAAVYLFIVNLIGLGVGPTAVALVTDYGFGNDLALKWSMLIVGTVANLAAIALLYAGLKPYRETIARMRAGG